VLGVVIALNLLGFVVVAAGGLQEGSTALSANALDFIADAATYAISLWVIGKSARVRSAAALAKGSSLAVMALLIVGYAVWRTVTGAPPSGEVISGLGLFGAAVNLVAALLLVRYREGDANVRSVWLCTRNDLLQCLAVAGAGGLVWLTQTRWPDLVAGVVLAALFLQSAWSIIAQARRELRPAPVPSADLITHSRHAGRRV
jgi:Co/Zn/Cd efflux system component